MEDQRSICICNHHVGVHSMFGCLTCAAEMENPCQYFVSKRVAHQLRDVFVKAMKR